MSLNTYFQSLNASITSDSQKTLVKNPKESALRKTDENIIYLSDAQKADIKEAFELFDSEGVGLIDNKDLKVAIRALGFEPTKEEIHAMLASVGAQGVGKLSYDNFLQLMTHKMSEKDTNDEILKAFRLFVDDGTQNISFANLKRVAMELGETMTDEELYEMIREADTTGNGVVDQTEFLRILKRSNIWENTYWTSQDTIGFMGFLGIYYLYYRFKYNKITIKKKHAKNISIFKHCKHIARIGVLVYQEAPKT